MIGDQMKRHLLRQSLVTLACAGLACLANAATVRCNIHAPLGYYNVFLFRVGDRDPIGYMNWVRIDGGKIVSFTRVHGGDYFVRATLVSDPYLTNQTPAGHLNFYWSTPLWLPDLYIRP
jgi:hypothetical protein